MPVNFRISDTFTSSLAKLSNDEQKQVKTTAFDLQMNPGNPGMSFHKLDKSKDKNFWSVRVSRDIRLIVHKSQSSLLLCYVDHHDKAYLWAERRKLEIHPKTGAAQLVEIRETVQEVSVPTYTVNQLIPDPKPQLFSNIDEETLLAYGVPKEWIGDVLEADEDSLLHLADHLPGEAAEALLELATGGKPELKTVAEPDTDPFEHPDAQRRFRVMADADELARALDFPWDKWTTFLHPTQRDLVEKDYSGPARVSGSAGTGKTIVALHRAVYLARKYENSRILLTTFSSILSNSLRLKLFCLVGKEPKLAERIDVESIDTIGQKLYKIHAEQPKIASQEQITEWIKKASSDIEELRFSPRFLLGEWNSVVDAWQLESWEEYKDIKRLGRKTRLQESQRKMLWNIFVKVKTNMREHGCITLAELFTQLANMMAHRSHPPYDYVVVDEAQDISVAQLRFLASFGASHHDSLFFAGDLGQRIFQTPFSWKSLGVDIRGRSQNLRINYRTSHQIRKQADRLLGPEVTDVDGNVEDRSGTVSVFNGPTPDVRIFEDNQKEIRAVATWIEELIKQGITPHEIGIFVRSPAQIDRAECVANQAGLPFKLLDEQMELAMDALTISTMHLAKGLEFRAVAVIGCDDEVLPLQERIESISDNADLEEIYETERHLLYVACTRARDNLIVTATEPASEFLDDLILS